MSGKQGKKERKAAREAQREALRKQERQRTIFTIIVIVIVLGIGGVLIALSVDDPSPEDQLADLLEDAATEEPTEGGEPTEEATEGEPAQEEPADEATEAAEETAAGTELPLQERPIACGAEEPPGAGEEKQTFDAPDQVLEEGTDYQAVVETSCGTVVIDLDEEETPEAANSFVFLAQQGFFDGQLIFRNAASIGALQTGAGDDSNTWQVGYQLGDELGTAEEVGYPPGSVAMANSGPDTAGSQFFFVYDESFQEGVEAGGLQPTYTRFGEVVEGLDVLQEIGAIEATGEEPTQRVYLESVTITTG